MFIQSFLSGVMRCGGMGILRISDLSDVLCAEAGRGGNAGASPCGGAVASVSIMTSSSPSFQFVSAGASVEGCSSAERSIS